MSNLPAESTPKWKMNTDLHHLIIVMYEAHRVGDVPDLLRQMLPKPPVFVDTDERSPLFVSRHHTPWYLIRPSGTCKECNGRWPHDGYLNMPGYLCEFCYAERHRYLPY